MAKTLAWPGLAWPGEDPLCLDAVLFEGLLPASDLESRVARLEHGPHGSSSLASRRKGGGGTVLPPAPTHEKADPPPTGNLTGHLTPGLPRTLMNPS